MLGLTEVELVHDGNQPARARRAVEQHCKLMRYTSVLIAGAGNHVAHALPDLIQTIHAGLAAALEQRLGRGPRRGRGSRLHVAP